MAARDPNIYKLVFSILAKQLVHRPVTLYSVYSLHSIGASRIKGILEKEKVSYILIPHHRKFYIRTVEIVIKSVPQDILDEISAWWFAHRHISQELTAKTIKASYQYLTQRARLRQHKRLEYFKVHPDSPGAVLSPEEEADPYFYYRISDAEFEELKDQLIKREELMRIAVARGYTQNQIRRAMGEPKMRYIQPSESWRPHLYQGAFYFHIKVLDVLDESDRMYLFHTHVFSRRADRLKRDPSFKDPMTFTSRKELFEALEKVKPEHYFEVPAYLIR